ncbi:hypothetical protein [Leptospira kmetyi]|uniref:hypothetical protein n=1 Tax=Leptospira kmetyi TaxID=408139 RepID=UPI003EBEA268
MNAFLQRRDHADAEYRNRHANPDRLITLIIRKDDFWATATLWPGSLPSYSRITFFGDKIVFSEDASFLIPNGIIQVNNLNRYDVSKKEACHFGEFENGKGKQCFCDHTGEPLNFRRRRYWFEASGDHCRPSEFLERWIAHIETLMRSNGMSYTTPSSNPAVIQFMRAFEESEFSP